MKNETIKVGFCIAYDWHLLKFSLPLVYPYADVICLSLDNQRISWSLNHFDFDADSFYAFVKSADPDNKIVILEENFHLPELSPMENEVRQRNRMAEILGKGGWHIQLDCDEYFPLFEKFTQYLFTLSESDARDTNVCCAWIVLYKKVDGGYLYVLPKDASGIEYMQFATKAPAYQHSRRNGNFNIYTNFQVLHQSWARTPIEIMDKLNNWGHSGDLDREQYFGIWQSVTDENYKEFHNIHPLTPPTWPRLAYAKGNTIEELVVNFASGNFPRVLPHTLRWINSRVGSRLRKIWKILWPS